MMPMTPLEIGCVVAVLVFAVLGVVLAGVAVARTVSDRIGRRRRRSRLPTINHGLSGPWRRGRR